MAADARSFSRAVGPSAAHRQKEHTMTSTMQNQAALLLHRERLQGALRTASVRSARKGARRFPRMQRSPLLRLA
jgi:hypothetical protein